MALFKERAANAKKVIALQNEIFSLKNKLAEVESTPKVDLQLQEALDLCKLECEEAKAEIKSLKADLKKARSEITRLTKKVAAKTEAE